jgi:hypothetical protein
MRRAATSGRALAALAGAAVLLAFSLTAFAAGEARPGPKRFRITGSATGLYPGGVGTLTLRVRVRDASRGCRASNLAIHRFRGFVDIRPRRTATLRLIARLSPRAPVACTGARFPLRFAARGSVW